MRDIRSPLDGFDSPFGRNGASAFVGPLDALTAAAAYSTRLLRSAYTGPAMRVRRSSDNAETDIGFTASGDLDTTALLAHTGAGDGFVTTWCDQSGNGRDATQTTAVDQPRIVNAGAVATINGKPTLIWPDAPNSCALVTSIQFPLQEAAMLMRYKDGLDNAWDTGFQGLITTHNTIDMIGWGSNTNTLYPTGLPLNKISINGGAEIDSIGYPILPLATAALYFRNTTTTATNRWLVIGRDRTYTGRGWSGPIAEVVVFSSGTVSADRVALSAGQMSYWSITP